MHQYSCLPLLPIPQYRALADGDACAGGELTTSLITDLTNLNKALEGKEAGSIVELQKGAIKAGPAMRNNGGGFYNHGMFFESMTSPAKSGAPSPALAKAIDASFGSMDEMKKQFSDAAAKRFGSGWAWLGVKPDGKVGGVYILCALMSTVVLAGPFL